MKEAYIRFMAPVTPQTSDQLIRIVDEKIRSGYDKLHLMISSPGGSVFHGLSLYNFLYGIPLEVDTYNFGSVDSIGVILFCAGKNRYSVPNARFLIHGVSFNFQGQASFDEKMLDEQLKGLQIDQSNIAKIIAFTAKKTRKK
jgi:ATP-dependent protease ClpP protease subunit